MPMTCDTRNINRVFGGGAAGRPSSEKRVGMAKVPAATTFLRATRWQNDTEAIELLPPPRLPRFGARHAARVCGTSCE